VLLTVQGSDSCFGFVIAGHFDESKALAATCFAVVDDLCGHDLAVGSEQLFQFRAVDVVAQVTNIQLLTHCDLLKWVCLARGARFFRGQYEEVETPTKRGETMLKRTRPQGVLS
jgi:hypothetical protein